MSSILKLTKKIFTKKKFRILNTGYLYRKKFKIVVFSPLHKADEVAFAMASKGAGEIGNYSVCSFRLKGIGTFKGNDKSNPFTGKAGNYEMAEEIRIEMICSSENLNDSITEMLRVHPYEEPAYEIYPVLVREKKKSTAFIVLKLEESYTILDIIKSLNKTLNLKFSESISGFEECKTILVCRGINENDISLIPETNNIFLLINFRKKKVELRIINKT